MFLLTYELIALIVLVRLLAVPMLCSQRMSLRTLFSVMVRSVLDLLLVTTAVNAHALFTVSAHMRALTLGVNVRVRALGLPLLTHPCSVRGLVFPASLRESKVS